MPDQFAFSLNEVNRLLLDLNQNIDTDPSGIICVPYDGFSLSGHSTLWRMVVGRNCLLSGKPKANVWCSYTPWRVFHTEEQALQLSRRTVTLTLKNKRYGALYHHFLLFCCGLDVVHWSFMLIPTRIFAAEPHSSTILLYLCIHLEQADRPCEKWCKTGGLQSRVLSFPSLTLWAVV